VSTNIPCASLTTSWRRDPREPRRLLRRGRILERFYRSDSSNDYPFFWGLQTDWSNFDETNDYSYDTALTVGADTRRLLCTSMARWFGYEP